MDVFSLCEKIFMMWKCLSKLHCNITFSFFLGNLAHNAVLNIPNMPTIVTMPMTTTTSSAVPAASVAVAGGQQTTVVSSTNANTPTVSSAQVCC